MVNMTSQEPAAWLRTRCAGQESEALPGRPGSPAGRQVLELLRKRRTDLTEDDVQVMYGVVDSVNARREHEPDADGTHRRHRLMALGHDPLRA
ncbi:DUF3140 domain-containing protein [Streptomyces heilongjiangensis]|uniref:DUF3140 domain-containing protein n=1 Tax=Streptomyces heilongjiangensis TaxID=945052 RepID=A0ABW1BBI8_9ACTN|nr:DUF3140 domain-containing protein [Streptomyces heilongjiangensis]MDC2950838.1 DUF3140 domain-containing protein [Streptomyces heilongjiangensis]